jgi:hypothetical protein
MKLFDLCEVSDIERLVVLSHAILPPNVVERNKWVLDKTGRFWLTAQMCRIKCVLDQCALAIRGEPRSFKNLLADNDWEEELLITEIDDIVFRFQGAMLMGKHGVYEEIWNFYAKNVTNVIAQLHEEELKFPTFIKPTCRFVVEDSGDDNIPQVLTYSARLNHLLSKSNSGGNDENDKSYIEWLQEWNDEIRKDRANLKYLEDEKLRAYVEPKVSRLNSELYKSRTLVNDFPTLVLFMYDLLPRSCSDELSINAIEKPRKWKLKKLNEAEEAEFQEQRETAFLFHRAEIFQKVVHDKFKFLPKLTKYLDLGRKKYCRPGVNYYMKENERRVLDERFRMALNIVVNEDELVPLGRRTWQTRKTSSKTVKEGIAELRAAGCAVSVPEVIDLESEENEPTTENQESDSELEERETRNLELLARHYSAQPNTEDEFAEPDDNEPKSPPYEPTTPPTEVTPPPEEDTTASAPPNEEEGEHILIRVMTAICSQHIFEGFCSLLKIQKNSDKKCSRAFLTRAFD